MHRALGMRIVDAGKSAYYHAALEHFDHARRCFERAGMTDRWDEVVAEIRSKHRRKSSFIGGFERIATGSGNRPEPFLERARKRWNPRR